MPSSAGADEDGEALGCLSSLVSRDLLPSGMLAFGTKPVMSR